MASIADVLKTFKGGIHPSDEKELTLKSSIEILPPPKQVSILLSQHIGAPSELVVAKGDAVKRGQVIARASGFVSTFQHASISGVVKEITTVRDLFGRQIQAVVIESDGKEESVDPLPPLSLNDAPDLLRQRLLECGVVGKGGASFPTHAKLSPPQNKPIDTVILNGVECEPYLTCDHHLMLTRPNKILRGLDLIAKIVGAKRKVIGIEANKLDAIAMLREKVAAGGYNVEIVPLQVKYPQGAEKQLIYAVTGRQVPRGGLPMDIGVVVQNVSTAKSVYDAVVLGLPLTVRTVTVTGRAIKNPKNLRVHLGTSFRDVIEACGGFTQPPVKVISGGPMMGVAIQELDVPVTKGTSGILCLLPEETKVYSYRQCIRCGRCVEACPVSLMPLELSQFVEKRDFDLADQGMVDLCMECGSCAYVCPSRRPLTQWFKWAKSEIAAAKRRGKKNV